ncbi:MAG TPA: sel1 repeat family protein, partial [Thiothrix sp.]|nr:sel1 repeat family protein [Thiothrix sp.]
VKQDNTKAVEWFAQAADQQFPLALTNLGVLYAQGFGVAHHIEKALGYYEQAAALQEAAALCYLGLLSEQGRGLVHDDEQAVDYYQQANVQADPIAQYCLGRMYQQGLGYLEQDQQQAQAYYRQAAKQHSAAAQVGLAYLLYEQATQTQSHSQSTQGAERRGSKFAQLSITNLTAIKKLYRQAAEKHHPVAQTLLATLYRDGISEPKTLPSAQDWYKKAAKQGNAIAQVCLGWLLYEQHAKSTPSPSTSTIKEMVSCYTQAAEQNNRVAQTYLAALYEAGKGVEKDPEMAFQWYTKAAVQQDVVAQNRLGELYETGLGTETDIPQALYWYRQTLQQDDTYEKAYTNLGRLVWQHYPHLLGDEMDQDTLSDDY